MQLRFLRCILAPLGVSSSSSIQPHPSLTGVVTSVTLVVYASDVKASSGVAPLPSTTEATYFRLSPSRAAVLTASQTYLDSPSTTSSDAGCSTDLGTLVRSFTVAVATFRPVSFIGHDITGDLFTSGTTWIEHTDVPCFTSITSGRFEGLPLCNNFFRRLRASFLRRRPI